MNANGQHHRHDGERRMDEQPAETEVAEANATWDALLDRLERKIEQAIIEARQEGQR